MSAKGVAELHGVGEVSAVVPALGPVHHQGVGGGEGPVPALGTPVDQGRGAAMESDSGHLKLAVVC